MKEYEVKITETLERVVKVRADSQAEAEEIVGDDWSAGDYVLGADDFTGVEFNVKSEKELKYDALLVRFGFYPERVTIGSDLKDLQKAVGGTIEVTYPFDDPVGLVVNEEGKINGYELNRALFTEDGEMYDIIAGDFLVLGLSDSGFDSLSPELMEKYEKHFHQPEMFVKLGRTIRVLPLPDDLVRENEEKRAAKEQEIPAYNQTGGRKL